MNYEELLEARMESQDIRSWLPIGDYRRRQVDGKWRGIITVRPELKENIVFEKALTAELESNKNLDNRHQLHMYLQSPDASQEGADAMTLLLDTGNYITFEQLLRDNPAVVAQKNFMDNMLEELVDITTFLHKHGIYHVCFSPQTILTRKGDSSPLLCSHGSFYLGMSDQRAFYGDNADFVAPEVLNGGTVDERCDVYSIGKFLQSLCDMSDIPLEFRKAIKKAVSESPEDRYATPKDMLADVNKRRGTLRSLLTLVIALVIALLGVVLYFDLFPDTQPVEFVKPVPRQPVDDLLDDGITPEELGLGPQDSAAIDSMPTQRDYNAKAEEIFRKNYEKEADRILSKIYNKDYMSNSEKKFRAESEETLKELMKLQSEMAEESGLTQERAQLVAAQIIDRISNQKKKALGVKTDIGSPKPVGSQEE